MTRRDEVRSAVAQPLPPPPAAPDRAGAGSERGTTGLEWASRQRLKAVDALRYSRFVSVMKGLLPIAAVLLLATVVGYALMPRSKERLIAVKQSQLTGRDLTMTKSSFTGTDDKGNPFKVTFAELIQDPTSKTHKRAELKQIDADMQFENQSWVSAQAAHGFIDADAGLLTLDGGISVFTDTGYELHTERATAYINKNIMTGDTAVEGHGPIGRFRANRFYVDRNKKVIKLSGQVRMTMYAQKADKK